MSILDRLKKLYNFVNKSSSLKTAIIARSIQTFLSKGVIFIALVLYLNKTGTQLSSIALLMAVYFAPQLFLNAAIGSISDLLESHEFFILFSLILSGFIYFFYPIAGESGVYLVLGLRFIQGILESPIRPLTQTLASSSGKKSNKNSAVSIFKISVFGAASLGPLAVGFSLEHFHYEFVFPIAGIILIATGIGLWVIAYRSISLTSTFENIFKLTRNSSLKRISLFFANTSIFSSFAGEEGGPSPFSASRWKTDPPSLFSLITFIRRTAFQIFLIFIPVYLANIVSLSEGGVGTIEGARRMLIALTIAFCGPLADRWGRKPFLIIASLSSFGPLIYLTFPTRSGALAASAVLGVTVGLFNPTSITYMRELAPENKGATYLGSLESTSAVSRTIGPIIGGVVASLAGLQVVFLIAGLVMFLTLPLSFFLQESKKPVKNGPV
ncbi:MFS transporter [Candidatus Bipolaricaulota bacterium]|nr:MFS transporter [Candidatus Bipolaricaulota bacterium]